MYYYLLKLKCILLFSGGDFIKDNQILNCVSHAKKRANTIHKLIKTAQ